MVVVAWVTATCAPGGVDGDGLGGLKEGQEVHRAGMVMSRVNLNRDSITR
jgi:hypothetical protein